MKSVPVRTQYIHFMTLLVRGMAKTGSKQSLDLAQERCWNLQKLGMVYYLTVI